MANPREALAQIAETARWYAENGDRQAHEVDHALTVEILSIAENALDPGAASGYRLLRLLTAEEMQRLPLMGGGVCQWSWREGLATRDCGEPSMYRLATPLGSLDVCERHIDGAIAGLPADFLDMWEEREPYVVPDTEDIPF